MERCLKIQSFPFINTYRHYKVLQIPNTLVFLRLAGFGPMWLMVDQCWCWIIDTVSAVCVPAGLQNTAPMFAMFAMFALLCHFFMMEEISRNTLWKRQGDSSDFSIHNMYFNLGYQQASVFYSVNKYSSSCLAGQTSIFLVEDFNMWI